MLSFSMLSFARKAASAGKFAWKSAPVPKFARKTAIPNFDILPPGTARLLRCNVIANARLLRSAPASPFLLPLGHTPRFLCVGYVLHADGEKTICIIPKKLPTDVAALEWLTRGCTYIYGVAHPLCKEVDVTVQYKVQFYGELDCGRWIGEEEVNVCGIEGFKRTLWCLKPPSPPFLLIEEHTKHLYSIISASIQDLVRRCEEEGGDWNSLPKLCIDDSHSSLCILELLRILVDIKGLKWFHAWNITKKVISWRNITTNRMSEQSWCYRFAQKRLPRHVDLMTRIDWELMLIAFCEFDDVDRIKSIRVVDYDRRRLLMSRLCIVAGGGAKSLAEIHHQVLKHEIFTRLSLMYPPVLEENILIPNINTPYGMLFHSSEEMYVHLDERPLQLEKAREWIKALIVDGANGKLLHCEGVLHIKDSDQVHILRLQDVGSNIHEGNYIIIRIRKWQPREVRVSRILLLGVDLKKQSITKTFQACRA